MKIAQISQQQKKKKQNLIRFAEAPSREEDKESSSKYLRWTVSSPGNRDRQCNSLLKGTSASQIASRLGAQTEALWYVNFSLFLPRDIKYLRGMFERLKEQLVLQ